jgi:serine/threonine-protein kinase
VTGDRWSRLDSIVHAALLRPVDARESFVREACKDDAGLHDEVLSLLKHDGTAPGFLETGPAPAGARLEPGQQLGPYRIEGFIDGGGMGEVYRATDPRIHREVAIKVLPPDVGGDPQRRDRFEREARAIGSLKHPNICPLFDVGEHHGRRFIVMELVEGETLEKRLEKGPLALDRALRHAVEIAAALDRAHRQGIVHRDLKPTNVIITKAGVKLIDFGLAKFGPSLRQAGSALPRRRPGSTVDGTLLGTLQYMSPEQIEGREADVRSDIFAFGAVFYEMVTGRKAFESDTQAGLITAILRDHPPPMSVPRAAAPAALDRVVKTCLEKDPDERWQSAADMARQLRWVADEQEQVTRAPSAQPGDASQGRRRMLWATAGLGAGVVLARFAPWVLSSASRTPTHSRLDIEPAKALHCSWTDGRGRLAKSVIALSPDGRVVVFAGLRAGGGTRPVNADRQLFRLTLDRADPATPIAGTDGGDMPFFSPDGRWIGFRVPVPGHAAPGEFKAVPLDGGPVQHLAATPDYGSGATWGDDGAIVFGGKGLKKIPAGGGQTSAVTTLRTGEVGHHHPHALPGGREWLYTVAHGHFADDVSVWAHSAKTGTSHLVIEDAADARYAPTGHLVFAREGKLMAAPFDADELRVTGNAIVIIDSVLQALNGGLNAYRLGTAQYAFSGGNLVYVTGGMNRDRTDGLRWLDLPSGKFRVLDVDKMPFGHPRLSPDQRRVAVTIRAAHETAVWVHDLTRGEIGKLPFDGYARFPFWTFRGERIVFTGEGKHIGDGNKQPFGLYSVPADGSAPATPLASGVGGVAASWDAEGNLIFVRPSATLEWTDTDIMLLSVKDNQVRRLLATPDVVEFDPTLSPDGQWLAYTSHEPSSGEFSRSEVFVQPYPALNRKFPVSNGGGRAPRWILNGTALLYAAGGEGTQRVMRVDVTYAPEFRLSPPVKVWEGPAGSLQRNSFPLPGFDATPDGRRLLVVQGEDPTPEPPKHITMVQDWFEELRAKMRAER